MTMNPEDPLGFSPEGAGEFEEPATAKYAERTGPNRELDIEAMTDPRKLARWMAVTRRLPLESIDKVIVERTYAAALWLFRSAAITGDIKATKAMEAWLNWAKPIINRKQAARGVTPSSGSVAFLPRETTVEENDIE